MKRIPLSFTNCYLIPIEDKYMLIDTGYPRDKKSFLKQLKKENIHTTDISYLFITHIHDDHIGLIHEVLKLNPSCKLILHVNGILPLTLGENDMSRSFYINKRVAGVLSLFKKIATTGFTPYHIREEDIRISDDCSLQSLGIPLDGKILCSPGHTTDSISLLLEDGSCFCGDAAANMLPYLGTKYCVIVVEDLKEYYASWQKLITHHAKTIYPGHGASFSIDKLSKYMNRQKTIHMRPSE